MTSTYISSADLAARRAGHAGTTAPGTKQARALSADQIRLLLTGATYREAALVSLMTAGALRVGECSLLQWGDITDGICSVPAAITKTRRARWFSLPDSTAKALAAWREAQRPSVWIFPGRDPDRPTTKRRLQQLITAMAQRKGIDGVSSHSFRRSAITAAHQNGLPLAAVAQLSGHASLSSLQRYLDAAPMRESTEAARGLLLP